jgi:hypothetical protein
MAAVGVHVELTVRFLTIGTPGKHTTAEVEVRRITVDAADLSNISVSGMKWGKYKRFHTSVSL